MSQFLETIKILNGRRYKLELHNQRMNMCRKEHFSIQNQIDLIKELQVPDSFKKGLVKCRVIYSEKIDDIQFEKYQFRNPRSFKVVFSDEIEYGYKSRNRKSLDHLFAQKEGTDDIIIVKNGSIRDSYYANLIFLREGHWYTPSVPLLKGVQRAYLLKKGILREIQISIVDIFSFEKMRIINSMTGFRMHPSVNINKENIVCNI